MCKQLTTASSENPRSSPAPRIIPRSSPRRPASGNVPDRRRRRVRRNRCNDAGDLRSVQLGRLHRYRMEDAGRPDGVGTGSHLLQPEGCIGHVRRLGRRPRRRQRRVRHLRPVLSGGTHHGISDVTTDGRYALATVERSGHWPMPNGSIDRSARQRCLQRSLAAEGRRIAGMAPHQQPDLRHGCADLAAVRQHGNARGVERAMAVGHAVRRLEAVRRRPDMVEGRAVTRQPEELPVQWPARGVRVHVGQLAGALRCRRPRWIALAQPPDHDPPREPDRDPDSPVAPRRGRQRVVQQTTTSSRFRSPAATGSSSPAAWARTGCRWSTGR